MRAVQSTAGGRRCPPEYLGQDEETREGFAAALLDPGRATPEGVTAPGGGAAGRRFDVYRNNVVVSLVDAMEAGFPVVERLLGEAFFRAMASAFVRAQPPSSPILAEYGGAFPDFLEGFPPVSHLPYLADVARLELALRESYHAADTVPVDPAALQSPGLFEARITFAPTVRLVASRWPIHAIWRANTGGGGEASGGAETVLVTRPAFDPVPLRLAPAAARFVAALHRGSPFGAALNAAGDGLDLAMTLTRLLDHNAVTAITEAP